MRPRKKVLLYCADEQICSAVSFLLETRMSVHVRQTVSPAQMLKAFQRYRFDAVVVYRTPSVQDVQVSELLRRRIVPLVEVLARQMPMGHGVLVEGNFPHNSYQILEILKRVLGKRGPKKAFPLARAA